MKDFFKNKIATGFVVIATFVLAGIAIFTAIRLYKLGREKPTTPMPIVADQPKVEEPETIAANELAFSIQAQESPPTPTPEATQTPTPTDTPSPTQTPSPTATKTPTPTTFLTSTADTIPEAGVTFPTIFGIGIGTLLITLALVLAI